MKQMSNTKKSLGKVWSRYFQLYGMTGKLTAACVDLGWTQMDMKTYAKEHYHLVNQLQLTWCEIMNWTYHNQETWNG